MSGAPVRGSLHHVELHASDLRRSAVFWDWFLGRLGWTLFQEWGGSEGGKSWILGDTYLVLVQAPADTRAAGFDRRRPGLNHLAFHAASRADVLEMTAALRERGVRILYEDRHPFAGGPGYFAVFFEDPEGIKVEFVAPEEPAPAAEPPAHAGDDSR